MIIALSNAKSQAAAEGGDQAAIMRKALEQVMKGEDDKKE